MNIIQRIKKKIDDSQKLSFIWADEFLSMLVVYRALWIKGRFGGGKTSLAVILAAWLMNTRNVVKSVANFPNVLSSDIDPYSLLYDVSILMDETHAFIGDRKGVDRYAKYLRKTNYFLLMPSVMPPHIKLCFFTVQRIFNGYRYGIPIWVYNWALKSGATSEKGYFAIWRPHLAFGSYPTRFVPFDDGGIGDAIDRTMDFEQWYSEKFREIIAKGEDTDDFKKEKQDEFIEYLKKGVNLKEQEELIKAAEKDALKKGVRKNVIQGKGNVIIQDTGNDFSDIQDALADATEELSEASDEIRAAARKVRRKIR